MCYSDHDFDISQVGKCEMCESTMTEAEKDHQISEILTLLGY